MATPRPVIERLEIRGFRSIRSQSIDLTRLNVMIGANGAGKSNLISYFAFLRATLNGNMESYIGRHGGPNSVLYLGAKFTRELASRITMNTPVGRGTFFQRLGFRAPDSLYFDPNHAGRSNGTDRSDEMTINGYASIIKDPSIGEGHPGLLIHTSLMDRLGIYHFHDTSLTSPLRTECYVEDNLQLRADGGNLAAMLYLYAKNHQMIFDRIGRTISKIVPQFDRFELEPQRLNPNNILLNWRQKGSDYLFGPHQLSDGSLRAMALVTLLLQPMNSLPDIIALDEPELGLHPHAIELIAGLIRAASETSQMIVAVQSQSFLDHFDPSEVLVVETSSDGTQFKRLEPEKLELWLEDYSLADLWQRNVIGGGPIP